MNDIAVALEHVDLFDCLDGLHVELLQRRLQFLVVRASALVHLFGLASRGTFAAVDVSQSSPRAHLHVRVAVWFD